MLGNLHFDKCLHFEPSAILSGNFSAFRETSRIVQRRIHNPATHLNRSFCKNNLWLEAVKYFSKTQHLRYFAYF